MLLDPEHCSAGSGIDSFAKPLKSNKTIACSFLICQASAPTYWNIFTPSVFGFWNIWWRGRSTWKLKTGVVFGQSSQWKMIPYISKDNQAEILMDKNNNWSEILKRRAFKMLLGRKNNFPSALLSLSVWSNKEIDMKRLTGENNQFINIPSCHLRPLQQVLIVHSLKWITNNLPYIYLITLLQAESTLPMKFLTASKLVSLLPWGFLHSRGTKVVLSQFLEGGG